MTTIYEAHVSTTVALRAHELSEKSLYARIGGNIVLVHATGEVWRVSDSKRAELESMLALKTATVVKL